MSSLRRWRVSLLWQILLSTSIVLGAVFAVTGWIVERQAERITAASIEEEVRGSFQAYESLWRSRADKLASVSLVLSRMSDVRAAFGTGDQATIRDTAKEIWSQVSHEDAIFLVTDPNGVVIASLGGFGEEAPRDLPVVRTAAARFPKQASGFLIRDDRLYQIEVTPVYVSTARGPALLDVLVAGYAVDSTLAHTLRQSTGGSDFVFLIGGHVVASTISDGITGSLAAIKPGVVRQVRLGASEYTALSTPLPDVAGRPAGELIVLRSFESARRRLSTLGRDIVLIWAASALIVLALTYWLARRILEPVKALDRAAAEIGRGNYDITVPSNNQNELGRLARTFNVMCASIRNARAELIRQERIATIGRLATSIVHDLRNPLAAIYGGAEMLVDDELSKEQTRRLASNIYKSSRRVQEMLQELADVNRGRALDSETCRLRDVVCAAIEAQQAQADSQHVEMRVDIPDALELPMERSRMERVFGNLISNALEAMPRGGQLEIGCERRERSVVVRIEDTGPGISREIADRLFEPFVTAGKKNGLGLGLALSRHTVLDHGGNLWADREARSGARFYLELPA